MQTFQQGARVYVSYNAVDVIEFTCIDTVGGLLQVAPVESERVVTTATRFVNKDEFEKVWSLYPQEAIAKRLRANILHYEESIKQLTDKLKDTESYIEYKKRMISNMLDEHKDIISKFPEMFL